MKKLYLMLFLPFLILSALSSAIPSFADFDSYQGTMNKEAVRKQLETLENNGACKDYYTLTNEAFILYATPSDKQEDKPEFILHLGNKQKPPSEIATFSPSANAQKPLADLRIALDPGHVGGKYAHVEERYIDIDVQTSEGIKTMQFDEGTLAVATAKILATLLTEFGADVLLTKDKPGESVYPVDFDSWYASYPDKTTQKSTVFRTVYNYLDLAARAQKINNFNPHVTLMIHYNGGNRYPNGKNIPTKANYCVTFIPGSFIQGELTKPEMRYEFVRLLVTETIAQSEKFSTIIAQEIKKELKVDLLDTWFYHPTSTLHRAPGVYCRNLVLARTVHSPLCYGETLLQDNPEEAQRLAQTDVIVDGIATSARVVAVARAYFKGICRFFGAY